MHSFTSAFLLSFVQNQRKVKKVEIEIKIELEIEMRIEKFQ